MPEKAREGPAAVIFDMDGLMLDTEGPAIDAWVRASRELGFGADREIALRTVGLDEPSTRAVLLEALGPGFPYEKSREKMGRIIFEDAERRGIAQKPGLLPLLDHLERKKIPLAVATSTGRRIAEWKLEKGKLRDRFPVIVCGDEVARGKPAPDIFLRAAEKLGLPPGDCIGIEDSPAGIRAIAGAGMRAVFIKDLVEPPDAVLGLIWRRFARLDEVIDLIP